ncbi:MAG: hypothetical protein KC560_13990, partial [Myxococcales bacterium]|nr:hypothetical protein [Myxococcales bacterium]
MATARRVDREARSALAVLALVAVAFAAYAPAYAYDFAKWDGYVWDDDDHYLHDPLIAAPDGWWRIWLDPRPGLVGTQGGAAVWNYWPLTRGSLWLDRHLFGELAPGRPNLFATHVANVALHALNAVLVFLVLRGLGVPGALLAGFVFAVHPVTVESVAWITERKNLLSTACFLLAVDAWRRLAAGGRARWYVATAAFHLLALMAKTSTVVLPVVLALLHFGARRRFDARTCARLAPLFAMSLVAGVTSIVFERDFIDAGGAVTASLAERVAIAIRIPWFYLAKVVAPVGLAFNYPRWRIDGLGALEIALGAATVGLACGAFALRDRHPLARPVAVGLGAFLAGLFPVLGVFDLYGMRYANVADHW